MLALIAGQGRLPALLADRLEAAGEAFSIFSLSGHEMDAAPGRSAEVFRIEHLGSFIESLVKRGFDTVCFAGAIRRPEIEPEKLDAATLPLLDRIMGAIGAGDDGALRIVMGLFEEQGLVIRSAQEIAPDLLLAAGVPSVAKPVAAHEFDARVGQAELVRMGAADLGQACVICQGKVVVREGPDGTDAMLAKVAGCAVGGVLLKGPKPQQDRRADMPTIGPQTVAGAAAAGLAGIVIEAGGVLVLDPSEVISGCNDQGLFLWIREVG